MAQFHSHSLSTKTKCEHPQLGIRTVHNWLKSRGPSDWANRPSKQYKAHPSAQKIRPTPTILCFIKPYPAYSCHSSVTVEKEYYTKLRIFPLVLFLYSSKKGFVAKIPKLKNVISNSVHKINLPL